MKQSIFKTWILGGVILITGFQAVANIAEDDRFSIFELRSDQYISELTDIINNIQLQEDTGYQIAQQVVSDKCVSFMNDQQFLGPNGKHIFKLLTEKSADYPNLLKGGNIARYCPAYPKMQLKNKSLVWVMILTMVAHFESSCDNKRSNKGPNGIANGYYQLHKGKEKNYTKSKTACPVNSSGKALQSSSCALAMIDDQLVRSNGVLFFDKSYWDVLRPDGSSQRAGQISKALTRSSLCNPRTI